ncbi:unnamed protein product (macronuclear) [Paramecium tetraurelia]|uniref:Uncharacterized protein n=1 Tax=Paramecium tetraurelia TaxID=5888 RepID=A0EFD4_PARTE|nr:uncharacterized protein GSPATT00026348001 [Paramecium tetraurelia]CAK94025.1 unnamed protein product [Paramecium tetraurelia]|eukprot:XP_001461398.1 hypothetical protein (macronuclear) [Paramecium tetraurelia strain d4-2]
MKVELRPSKQGGLYSLNLGQNNGPYLPKDIMLTNQKSLKLLQGDEVSKSVSQVLTRAGMGQLYEPPDIYDEKSKQFVNLDEKYKTRMSASDNVAAMSTLYTTSIKQLQDSLQEYKELIKKTEEELKNMNEKINNDNITNIRELQPMLKSFHSKLKERLHDEKNENYKLMREIEGLNRDKLQIQQSILFSHKRIMELEKLVGIQHKTDSLFAQKIQEEDANENENEDELDNSQKDQDSQMSESYD